MCEFFSLNYTQARQRFLQYADEAGANLDHYQLNVTGPEGQALHTDFAWIGTRAPRRIVIVQSGVHGVEAFAGAAIQCQLLKNLPVLPGDTALILVHVLNPFGMTWLRRANASNVDLNRNCLHGEQLYSGASSGYIRLNQLINPRSPPGRDGFLLKTLLAVLRYGFTPLKQAIALGQYEYPKGLFYGGAELEQEPRRYRDWLRRCIREPEQVLVVDLHTGLGRFGQCQLFSAYPVSKKLTRELALLLDAAVALDKFNAGAYDINGSVANLVKEVFSTAHLIYLTAEFGTCSALRVLYALREENRCHFYVQHDCDHPAKRRLKETLCPDSAKWKNLVVQQGHMLINNLLGFVSYS